MILYFLRHGQAGSRETWEGDDAQRPLTKKGKDSMDREAETIAELGLGLDVILTSPLVRAQQTAEIVAKKLHMKDGLKEDERLSPGFGIEKLSQILADYPDGKALMLVGHEPDFSQTVSALIGGGRVVCKKGGVARVDLLEGEEGLKGELVWLLPPKDLIRPV
jgi:phosphohistidine phosphatase